MNSRDNSNDGSRGNIKAWIHSNPNTICDICGRKRKTSETVLAYGSGDIPIIVSCIDGCADYRHPLNSPPPIIFDGQPVPDARPDETEDSNNPIWFVQIFVPSFMTWGRFQKTGGWGTLNDSNSVFNTNVPWTWGAFSRS